MKKKINATSKIGTDAKGKNKTGIETKRSQKKIMSRERKLTARDRERLWGDEGPYSQVRLCEETRILDDTVSRVFLVIEAEINPFTFEYIQKNRHKFLHDTMVLQLLDQAEYRDDEYGYIVSAGEMKLEEGDSRIVAKKQTSMMVQTLIRMHKFIMKEFNLGIGDTMEEPDSMPGENRSSKKFIWNEHIGGVQKVNDRMLRDQILLTSLSAVKSNKTRFYFVLVFGEGFDFKKHTVMSFIENMAAIVEDFDVELEDCESFFDHMLVTVLIPVDVAPVDLIEIIINISNKGAKKPLFGKHYISSHVTKPTQQEILSIIEKNK